MSRAHTARVEWTQALRRAPFWRKSYLCGWVNSGLFEKQKPPTGLITFLVIASLSEHGVLLKDY